MPGPDKHWLVLVDKLQCFPNFRGLQAFRLRNRDITQPNLDGATTLFEMHMGGFGALAGKEIESVTPDTQDGGHKEGIPHMERLFVEGSFKNLAGLGIGSVTRSREGREVFSGSNPIPTLRAFA